MKELMFQDDEILPAKELIARLNIPLGTWKGSRRKILDYLSLWCDYEVVGKGSGTMYHIIEQIGEYEPYNGRRSAAENAKIYSPVIQESLKKHPIATFTSINEDVIRDDQVKALNHAKATSYNYVRKITKKENTIEDKLWCRKHDDRIHWVVLNPEELANWKEILHAKFVTQEEDQATLINDKRNGLISKKEFSEKIADLALTSYSRAEDEFASIHGFIPRKVPRWMIGKQEWENQSKDPESADLATAVDSTVINSSH